MNLLIDPSAETQSAAWLPSANGFATFSQDTFLSGAWSFRLRRGKITIDELEFWDSGSFAQEAIPLPDVGETTEVSLWVMVSGPASDRGVRIEADSGGGTFDQSADFIGLPAGWNQVAMPAFQVTGPVGRLQFTVLGPVSAGALIYCDDIEWNWPGAEAGVRRSKHLAYRGLIATLKGIGGAGYHLDLGQRVYPFLFLPKEKAIELPYACAPLVDRFTFDSHERSGWSAFETPVHVFVDDTAADDLDSLASERCAMVHDDVVKALLSDPTLGGSVQDVTIIGGESYAGLLPGERWGEVVFGIRIGNEIAPDVLGP